MDDKIGIFSFFAGAGFLDLGFEYTKKYDILFVNEIHRPFMNIYQYSRERMGIDGPRYGSSISDVTSFLEKENLAKLCEKVKDAQRDYRLVGFIGGPPCPDFSVGGKNKGKKGENGKLSGTYTNLICKIKPDFFLFENVKGLYRTKKHREFFETLKKRFIKAGYLLSEKLINAIEYGVPQDRERIILVGFHKNILHKKRGGYLDCFDWNLHRLYDTDSVFNKNWPKTTEFSESKKMNPPKGIIPELTVEYWFKKNNVDNHYNKNRYFIPRQGLQRFKEIFEGDDKKKSFKRLHRWRYSPTAAYGNNEVHLHPYKARRLSASEALAIQSLPKEYVVPNNITLSDTFKAIGNGVPFLAAKGLALSIYEYINKIMDNGKINSK